LGKTKSTSPQTAKDFAGDSGISFGCWLQLKGKQSGAPVARMKDGDGYVGFDLYLQDNQVAAHFVNKWPENAIKVAANKKLEKNKWYHVFVTYDGSKKGKGVKVFVDGEHLKHRSNRDSLEGSTITKAPFTVGRRTSVLILTDSLTTFAFSTANFRNRKLLKSPKLIRFLVCLQSNQRNELKIKNNSCSPFSFRGKSKNIRS